MYQHTPVRHRLESGTGSKKTVQGQGIAAASTMKPARAMRSDAKPRDEGSATKIRASGMDDATR